MGERAVLAVENLTKDYSIKPGWFRRSQILNVLSGVSFFLNRAQTLAIVGESGSGKSTLARQLVGAEKPTNGRVIIHNIDTSVANRKERRRAFRQVRMIFQNPQASLNPRERVGSLLEEPLRNNTRLSSFERRTLAEEALVRVGLRPEHTRRYPHMFSGGQRQRIAIARAIMLQPSVIVADEPTSALDVSVQAQVLNLLLELQESMGLSFVFISHDLKVVEHISHQVLVMFAGRVMEYGSVEQIFDAPRHPYTKALLASTPGYHHAQQIPANPVVTVHEKLIASASPGCCYAVRCPYADEQCRIAVPVPRSLHGQVVACHKSEEIN